MYRITATSVTADTCLTAYPGVANSISARSHIFVEIDHEIIYTAILLPSADSRRTVVSYDRANECVYSLVKFANEKVWLGELSVPT